LARDVGVTVPTIKSWLSVLEASHQIFLLPPYLKNFGKRLIKSPKLYFIDTGIASFLLGLHDAEPLIKGPMFGPLFETLDRI
jgi:predicted AAA+ superfamily ATPase